MLYMHALPSLHQFSGYNFSSTLILPILCYSWVAYCCFRQKYTPSIGQFSICVVVVYCRTLWPKIFWRLTDDAPNSFITFNGLFLCAQQVSRRWMATALIVLKIRQLIGQEPLVRFYAWREALFWLIGLFVLKECKISLPLISIPPQLSGS